MWRNIRILLLLFILATVAQQAFLKDGAPKWHKTLYVTIYPINADHSEAAKTSIASLEESQLSEIETYFNAQAQHYQLGLSQPFALRLGQVLQTEPPKPNINTGLDSILWSLHFRFWAYWNSPKTNVPADIRLYVLFHDPAISPTLRHSTALSKGRIGLVNVFAGKAAVQQNHVVMAHELLHTVAATDKYDLHTNLPLYPDGYAEPDLQPRLPQRLTELMAGRKPISEHLAEMPDSLSETVIGALTAKEIGWIQ